MELCKSSNLAKHQSSADSAVLVMTRISAVSTLDFKAMSSFLYIYCKMHVPHKKPSKNISEEHIFAQAMTNLQ